jgi:hypothetical protein
VKYLKGARAVIEIEFHWVKAVRDVAGRSEKRLKV